jgi:hypothetical protein
MFTTKCDKPGERMTHDRTLNVVDSGTDVLNFQLYLWK